MYDILEKLTNIEVGLGGVVLSVVATAMVSLITLLVDFIQKIVVNCRTYNKEQQEKMKVFYPELKSKLVYLNLLIKDLNKNPLCTTLPKVYSDYELFTKNQKQYRNDNKNELKHIDSFMDKTKTWVDNVVILSEYFNNSDIPFTPLYHPILKYNARKMLESLQFYSFLVYQYKNNKISADVFLEEMKLLYDDKKTTVDEACLQKYIKILYKWYLKY